MYFLSKHYCFSLLSLAVVFFYVSSISFQIANMYIMIFLESFLLVGLSSQLSKLLIVYTEIVQLPKPGSMKQTVICIITGTCKCLSCVSNLFCYIKFYSSPVHNTKIKLEPNFSTSFESLAICFYVAKFRAFDYNFFGPQ